LNVNFTGSGLLDSTNPDRIIQVGLASNDAPGGYFAIDGNLDDYAMWNTELGAGFIKSLNTAPALLSGYNAGTMNTLFTAYGAAGSATIGALEWTYNTSIDTTGHAMGDTWLSGGTYNMWLEGASSGLSAVPEPATWGMVTIGALVCVTFRRRTQTRRNNAQ